MDKNKVVSNVKDIKSNAKKHGIIPKIIALLLAFVCWFYVMSVESPINEKTFKDIPITINESNSADLTVYSGTGATVDITVSGKRSDINTIKAEDFSVSVDVSSYLEPGEYSVPIKVTIPEQVTLVSKSIDKLSVYLDAKFTTKVPVVIELTDYVLGDGLELCPQSEIEKSISEVQISGPEAEVKKVVSAKASISCGEISSSIKASSSLSLFDEAGEEVVNPLIKMAKDKVEVKIPIYTEVELPLSVDFKNKLLNSDNCEVTISPKSLHFHGPVEEFKDRTSYTINTIDEKTLTENKLTVPIKLADKVTVSEGTENAEITISHKGTTTKNITVTNIEYQNPDGLSFTPTSDTLNVILRGTAAELEKATADNVSATVDLSKQKSGAGNVTVPVVIKISNEVTGVYEIGEYNIGIVVN